MICAFFDCVMDKILKVHKFFTKNQHSPIDSANNKCYITYRTKEEEQKEEFRIWS